MIAYLQEKGVTVDVPDDIGDKELGDLAQNFSAHVGAENPTPSGEAMKPMEAPSPEPASSPKSKWSPNFWESYIKPALGSLLPINAIEKASEVPAIENAVETGAQAAGEGLMSLPPGSGPLGLPKELSQTPEMRAFAGKAAQAMTFGLSKSVFDPLLDEEYKDHPVWSTAGQVTGDLGSLLATGGALNIAGLGAEATEIGAEGAKYLASAPRFVPRAIMTGATFGTKTFVEKTVKAFQDGQVDLGEFGKAVLLQSVGGAALGSIGGIANIPTAIASAGGLGFTMAKAEGADNKEALLSAAVWSAFEAVGSFGRSETLNREAIQTVSDSIGNYVKTTNPEMRPETASAIGDAIVQREAAKVGGVDAIVKGETGKENTLQLIEEINQKIRQGKIQEPIQTINEQPRIETGTSMGEAETTPAGAPVGHQGYLPAPDTVAPSALQPPPISETLPVQTEESVKAPNTVFQPTAISSQESIANHPDFIKISDDATAIVNHYAKQRGIEVTPDLPKKLFKELHDKLGEIMQTPPADRPSVIERIKAEYPDIQHEFATLKDKLYTDTTEGWFERNIAGKYNEAGRPKVALEAEQNASRGTIPSTEIQPEKSTIKPVKLDEQGIPIRKPGSVVSTVELADGQKAKITHQMVLDEADGLLQKLQTERGGAGELEKFVMENGKMKSFSADETGKVPEAEEMRDVPLRFKGGNHFPDEMAQMAYDAGLLEEPSADLLRTKLKTIPVRGKEPRLADFYDQAQHELEGYFHGLGRDESLPAWVTEDQGGTDEIAAEKVATYQVDQTKTSEFKKWFGDSKVVDEKGQPKIFYHSTTNPEQMREFEKRGGLAGHFGTLEAAQDRMRQAREDGTFDENAPASMVPVYLSIKNPVRMDDIHFDEASIMAANLIVHDVFSAREGIKLGAHGDWQGREKNEKMMEKIVEALKKKGYDGIVYKNRIEDPGSDTYIPFESTQIKSAIGNQGAFNPTNPNILSEPTASPYQQEFDFSKKPEAPKGQELHEVRGGFKAIMKPHLEVEFKKTGAVMIPNRKIDSPADLAYAFKQLRNEAQENFFLGAIKNNRIVAVEHMGFGTIDQMAVYPFETINLIDKNDADGFFIVHNHPSGEVQPSDEDKSLTNALKSIMEKNGVEFKGHVIIDDTKFGFIAPDGSVSEQTHKEYEKTKDLPILRKHFEWQRAKASIAEGPVLNSPQKAFELFKGIQKSPDEGAAYLMDTQNRILNIVILPKNKFDAATLQRLAAAYRAHGLITINSGLDDSGFKNLRNELRNAQISLHDDISQQQSLYQSKLERLGEQRAQKYAAAEPAAPYGSENPADRYNRLKEEAKAKGMRPGEAAAWAKEQILKGNEEPTLFPEVSPESIPTLNDAVENLKEMGDEIRNLVTPSVSAPRAGEILRENLGKMARSYDKAETALRKAMDLFDTFSPKDLTEFIDRMEHGKPQSNTQLDTIAKTLRKLFDDKRQQVQDLGTGKLQSFIENYFPHIWDQSEVTVSKATMKAAKRPLEGSKSFLKKRTITYFKDGIKLGLTPVSYNPVELTLLKIREMDKYIAAHQTLNALKEEGLAKFVRVGGDVPEGWMKIDDKISTVMYKTDQGLVISGHYYTQADAARLINNYLKPGLQKFALFRAYRYAGNLLNQFQLGFSAFHLGFTSMDSIVSKMALAVNQLALGHPLSAIKDALHAPIAPVENLLRGDKVMKAWMGTGSSGFDEVMASAMESAGGRARMDQFYATKAWDQMKKYFRMGAPVRGILHLPLAITEISSKPILEYIVPRQKIGIFADIMRMEMEHNPNMTHDELRTIAQRAWDSVDNRMGQLVYDNLFWNKTFKDLLMGSVRSVGWNLGTIRELAGGIYDVKQLEFNPKKIDFSEKGRGLNLSYRTSYFVMLGFTVGMFGAIYQYLKTGKGPETLKDYFYPRTGGLDNNGLPARVALPSYMKDVYHYSQAPVQTVLNKLNPVIAMLQQMYANKDFYGVKIRNEDDPLVHQVASEVGYILKQMEPFGLRNMQKNIQAGNKSLSDIIEPWIGITPAPYDINQTKAERIAHQISRDKTAIGGRTQEQADHTALLRQISKLFQVKDPTAETAMMQAFKDGKISTNDMTDLIRKSRMTPLQRQVSNFSVDELRRVYNAGTEDEKAQLERMLELKDIRHKSHYVPQNSK